VDAGYRQQRSWQIFPAAAEGVSAELCLISGITERLLVIKQRAHGATTKISRAVDLSSV
jgi:hypothetical protein